MNGIQETANIWNKFDGVNIEKSFNDNKHIWFQLGSRDEMGLKLMENTRFYYKGGCVCPYYENTTRDKTIVDLNELIEVLPDMDIIIAHEIGHCFGLSHHITRETSVMYYSDSELANRVYQIYINNLKQIDKK